MAIVEQREGQVYFYGKEIGPVGGGKIMGCVPDPSCKHWGPADYAACSGYPINDARAKEAHHYADRVGTDWRSMCYVLASLYIGRLIYWKKHPGDCGQTTTIDLGATVGIARGLKLSAGISGATASGIAALAPTAAIGPTVGAVATGIGLAALPFAVWGIFNAHHAVAVRREQVTLCDVATAFNQFSDVVEVSLGQGQLSAEDATTATKQVEPQLLQHMDVIKKQGNFAYGMEFALRAIDLYNIEQLYPQAKIDRVAFKSKVSGKALASATAIAAAAAVVA